VRLRRRRQEHIPPTVADSISDPNRVPLCITVTVDRNSRLVDAAAGRSSVGMTEVCRWVDKPGHPARAPAGSSEPDPAGDPKEALVGAVTAAPLTPVRPHDTVEAEPPIVRWLRWVTTQRVLLVATLSGAAAYGCTHLAESGYLTQLGFSPDEVSANSRRSSRAPSRGCS
jgi:hypothetical protein